MEINQLHNQNHLLDSYIDNEDLAIQSEELEAVFKEIIRREHISEDLLPLYKNIYLPLSAWIAARHFDQPIVIGINGAQGSGKSTISKILKSLLVKGFSKSVIYFSLDDLYLSKNKRNELAKSIHPLLKTRGVPGTHDVQMGINILSKLINDRKVNIKLPVFDKANDDLLPEDDWILITEPVDIILFEGWCVGSKPQNQQYLSGPINELEQEEDPHNIWKTYVNQQLAGSYQKLFGYIDYLIMLQVPDMQSIFEWRSLQEKKLKEACFMKGEKIDNIMSEKQIERFIMHYERITRHTLDEMPDRVDILFKINKEHQIYDVRMKE